MASNQGDRQAAVRAITGTALSYEGDWHALFDLSGIRVGDFNGRLLAWINQGLGTSYTEINGAKAALAVSAGVSNWDSLTSLGGASAPRVVANRGEFYMTLQTAAGANSLRVESRKYMTTGNAPLRAIRFVYAGFYITTANVETNCGNDQVVESGAELVGAPNITRLCTFNGAPTGTIVDGVARYATDWLYASAFGLSSFPAGSVFYCRDRKDVTLGQLMPRCPATGSGISGEGTFFSNGASPSQVSAIGAMATQTGGSSLGGRDFGPICMEGLAAGLHDIAVLSIGDSLPAGGSDSLFPNGSDGSLPSAGGGFVQRSLKSINSRSVPYLSMAYAGTQAAQFVGNMTKRATYFPYCTHLVENYGTNDFGDSARTAAQVYADRQTIWMAARAAKIRHIECLPIFPRTTSSDLFVTVVNQTPRPGYETGGSFRDPMNANLATALSLGLIDGLININTVAADSVALDKWVAPSDTADGTHPLPVIAPALAAVLTARAQNWTSP